jgi:multiple sugar transport system substrate-binding protein
MKNRKFTLGAGIFLSASLLLAACGGDASSSDEADAATAEKGETVEVTFWHAMNGPHQEAITELTDKFNESQDEIVVKEMNQGDYSSLQQSIMAAGVSNDLPTMSQLTPGQVPDLAENNLLQPLDDLIVSDTAFSQEELDEVYEGFLEGVKYDGKMYSMPFSKSTRIMFYNQEILDEYGVDVPASWDEVIELGEKMTEAGDERVAMGLENSFEMEFETMARQNGSAFIDQETLQVDIDSPESVEALQFLVDAVNNDHARTAGEDGYFSGPFSRGESALYIGSSAGVAHVQPSADENGLDWGTAEIPTFNDEKLTLLAGNDLGVYASATEEEKEAAVSFIHFLLQPENTAFWAMETGYVPITRAAQDVPEYQAFLEENPTAEAANKELVYAANSAMFKGHGEYRNAFIETLDDVLINGTDVQEALTGLDQQTESITENN